MTTDPVDRDLLRFQATRDPAALAAVFDAVAPRLLLVAMHLVRDAATAEDLVQTVFLQVLRDIGSFDARRPAMPWLLGMLEHRAADLRRRAHVAREREHVGVDVAPSAAPSPPRAAVDAETRERVAEALAGMPPEYRSVLTFRLVHGIAAVDIAHSLGVPPATVRTRLRRGLELLRNALPRGLATTALLAWFGGEALRARDGLRAVRAKVLAAAGAHAPVAVGAWWFAVAGAALLAVMAAWQLAGSPRHDASPVVDGASVAATAPARGRDAAGPVASPSADSSRLREPQAASGAHDARSAHLWGRVVAAETGLPLAGVRVAVRSYPSHGRSGVADPWQDPPPVESAADGAFAVAFVPSRERAVELVFTSVGRVLEARGFEPLREAAAIDTGTVAMSAGTSLRLRVVRGGQPVGDQELNLAYRVDGQRSNSAGCYRTDGDGCVDLGVTAPGSYDYEVCCVLPGHTGTFEVPLQGGELLQTIALGEPERDTTIRGALVDIVGAPVVGVQLGLPSPDGRGHYVSRTDSLGRFAFARPLGAPSRVRVAMFTPPRDLAWVDDGGDLAWGGAEVRLVVRRRAPATLRIDVVDAATGEPVEGFGTACWYDPSSARADGATAFATAPIRTHTGGIAVVEGLTPGRAFVSVFPPAPYAESAEHEVDLAEGATTTLHVALRNVAACSITAIDAATGAPRSGVEVVLAKVVPATRLAEVDLRTFRIDVAKARAGRGWSSGTNVLELARGTTDAAGVATLQVPPDQPALVLYAEGPRCQSVLQKSVVVPVGGVRVTVAVVAAGQVRGRIVPQAFVERFGPSPDMLARHAERARTQFVDDGEFVDDYPTVELRSLDGDDRPVRAQVAADGAFASGGMRPGRYSCWLRVESRSAPGVHARAVLGPLATIAVGAEGPCDVRIDASALMPGKVKITCFVDGRPFQGGLELSAENGRAHLSCDAHGCAASPWLAPGRYVAMCHFDAGTPTTFATLDSRPIEIVAGGDVDAVVTMDRRAVAIELVDDGGAPLARRWIRLRSLDQPLLADRFDCVRTDAAGVARFPASPPGRLQVLLLDDQQVIERADDAGMSLGELDATASTARLVAGR